MSLTLKVLLFVALGLAIFLGLRRIWRDWRKQFKALDKADHERDLRERARPDVVTLKRSADGVFRRELLADQAQAVPPHLYRRVTVAQDPFNRSSNGGGVARRHGIAGHSILEPFSHSTNIEGHDRDAVRQCLESHDAQGFRPQ